MSEIDENSVGGIFSSLKRFDRIDERKIPSFPKTPHLPHNPVVLGDDVIASKSDSDIIFAQKSYFEEKIDGSSVGIRLEDGHFVVRNRNNILSKGYTKKNTPAKKQFRPLWGWCEENREKFEQLKEILGFTPTIYGEWLVAKHTIYYDMLPSLFIAYDIYDFEKKKFLSPKVYRKAFETVGFSVPQPLSFGACKLSNYGELENHLTRNTPWSFVGKIEGVYVKVVDEKDEFITNRFKIVRPDFKTDPKWNENEIVKNLVVKH